MKRRNFLRALTAAPAAPLLAQQTTAQAGAVQQFPTTSLDAAGESAPSFFTASQLGALRRLGNLFVPARDGYPGAVEAKAPEFLDFLVSVSPAADQQLYRNGLEALNAQANRQFKKSFADLDDAQADAVIRPLLVAIPWEKDMPDDPLKHFVAQARRDLETATRNSREWATAASTSGSRGGRGGRGFGGFGGGQGAYILPIDPIYKG